MLDCHIVDYMETNHLFNCNQHGFHKDRSCITHVQLLEVTNSWTAAIDNSDCIFIYLNFRQAFDSVRHK